MADNLTPEQWHAKLDWLATDLLEVKHEMENRGLSAAETSQLSKAFGVVLAEAQRNAAFLTPDPNNP